MADLCRRHLFTAAAMAALLPACAGLDRDGKVTLSEREINRLLEQRFPIERRLLEVFDVTVAAPRVRLLPERNRLAALLDFAARERILGGAWKGQLDFDSQLRWDPRDQSVRLAQVRVQDLALSGLGAAGGGAGAPRSAAERLGGALAERVLEDMSIYTLPPERAERLRRANTSPAAVTVTARGVEITLVDSAN